MAKKLVHYKLNENEIIFAASFAKRFSARLLDFIMAGLIGKLLLTIYSSITIPYIPENPTMEFNNYIMEQYNYVMMIGWTLLISGYITTLYVFPLLNKKNPGQTIGKKILKITPMYLHDSKPYLSIIMREGFVSGLQILSLIFITANGINASYVFAKYQNYINAQDPNSVPEDVITNYWDFIMYGWTSSEIMGEQAVQSWNVGFAYVSTLLLIFWTILLLVLAGSIAFVPSKRGLHDMITSIAIVNLKSKTDKSNYINMYTPQVGDFTKVNDLPVILKK